MAKQVGRAGAVVALALLTMTAAAAQSTSIIVENLEWDPAVGGNLIAFSNAPSDWLLGLYRFEPDAGWSFTGAYGRVPTGPYAGRFVAPLGAWPRATKLALFHILSSEQIGNLIYFNLDALPPFLSAPLTSRSVLVLTRNSVYRQTLEFAGNTWMIKDSWGTIVGPGPNRFCANNTFVDSLGKLHLRIDGTGPACGSEVILRKGPGYGRYRFTVETPLNALHPNAVLGMFTWSAEAPAPHREIDIEISQWAGTVNTNAQFVVQPYGNPGNMLRFNAPASTGGNVFTFDWAPDSVQFSGPNTTFTVGGSGVPLSADETLRLNFYWYLGVSGGTAQEVVISNFEFTPSTRIGVTPTTDLALFAPASGMRIPTLNVNLPEPWTFGNLPDHVRAARVGTSNNVDFTIMPNWSPNLRLNLGQIGSRSWMVSQGAAEGTIEQRMVGMLYYNTLGRVPLDEERDFQVVKALHQGVSKGELATRFFTSREFQLSGYFIAGLYAGLLCRDPEYPGWLWQRDAQRSGLQSQRGLVSSFVNSQEFALRHGSDNASVVNGIYRCALGRLPSNAELQFQVNALNAGASRTDFALSVLSSPEFQLMTDKQITAFLLYATLLNRDASAAEKAGWVNVLQSTPLRNVIDGFVNAPEFSLRLQ